MKNLFRLVSLVSLFTLISCGEKTTTTKCQNNFNYNGYTCVKTTKVVDIKPEKKPEIKKDRCDTPEARIIVGCPKLNKTIVQKCLKYFSAENNDLYNRCIENFISNEAYQSAQN
ncbi:MAG: hypothetical protein DRQ88_09285 [Epsilonproteobacteria bacterium]|nr:MAG: hypothetical protein DRQ88_09285 [Campylobacterota bacterium]